MMKQFVKKLPKGYKLSDLMRYHMNTCRNCKRVVPGEYYSIRTDRGFTAERFFFAPQCCSKRCSEQVVMRSIHTW